MSVINQLKATTKKGAKRVGRGYGGGKGGHTCGRGSKGAGARKSSHLPLYFEGGQLPTVKKMPMIRGKSRFKSFAKVSELNLSDLAKLEAQVISLETLKVAGLVPHGAKAVKIIATGKLTQAVTVSGLRLSAGAKKALLAAGGKIAA